MGKRGSRFTQQVFQVTLTGYVTADPERIREDYRLDDLELSDLFESMLQGFGPHVEIEPMVRASTEAGPEKEVSDA